MGGRRDGRRGTRYTDAEKALAQHMGIKVEHLGVHKITNVRWLEPGVIGANMSVVMPAYVESITVPIHLFNLPPEPVDGSTVIDGPKTLTEDDLVRAAGNPKD